MSARVIVVYLPVIVWLLLVSFTVTVMFPSSTLSPYLSITSTTIVTFPTVLFCAVTIVVVLILLIDYELNSFKCPEGKNLHFFGQYIEPHKDPEKPDKIKRLYSNYNACKNCKSRK